MNQEEQIEQGTNAESFCPNCGLRGEQAKLPHTCRKPPVGEFTKYIEEHWPLILSTGNETWLGRELKEACVRLDAQAERIEKLKAIFLRYRMATRTISTKIDDAKMSASLFYLVEAMNKEFEQSVKQALEGNQ